MSESNEKAKLSRWGLKKSIRFNTYLPFLTEKSLPEDGIEIIAAKTGQAWGIFNEQIEKGKKVVGVFHLMC